MSKKQILLKSKERRDIQSVAAFFKQLSEKLTQNKLVFHRGGEEVTVTLPDNVAFRVKVKKKVKRRKTKHSMKITLKWVEGADSGGMITLE